MTIDCLDKSLRLGVPTRVVSAQDVLADVMRIGRRVGLLRCLSARERLERPVQRTSLWKHLKGAKGRVRHNETSYVSALLQNADVPLGRLEDLLDQLSAIEREHSAVPDSELVHGKDAQEIFGKALSCFKVCKDDAARLLWTSFERGWVEDGSTLDKVRGYLSGRVD